MARRRNPTWETATELLLTDTLNSVGEGRVTAKLAPTKFQRVTGAGSGSLVVTSVSSRTDGERIFNSVAPMGAIARGLWAFTKTAADENITAVATRIVLMRRRRFGITLQKRGRRPLGQYPERCLVRGKVQLKRTAARVRDPFKSVCCITITDSDCGR